MQFKKTYILSPLVFSLTLVTSSSHAGVVILSKVPAALKALLAQAQALVQQTVEETNKISPDQYVFEKNCYEPHITLAYVSDKDLSMDQFEKEDATLVIDLTTLTDRPAIDMQHVLSKSQLTVWKGKKESIYEEKTYKNSAILVVKMAATESLINLVKDIDTTLEKHPTTLKREFPFSAHATIGYIYDAKDIDPNPIVNALKPSLEKLIAEFKTDEPFTIDSFKLSAHDLKQVEFPFKNSKISAL